MAASVSDIAAKRAELKKLTVSVVERRRELKAIDVQIAQRRATQQTARTFTPPPGRPVHKRTTTMHDAVRGLGAARLRILDAS
jgi:hypothetical protein